MKRIKFAVALALCLCSSALMRAQTHTGGGGGGGGTSVKVNGSQVSNPNFNATTPLPDSGYSVATFKVSGSSVILEYTLVGLPVGTAISTLDSGTPSLTASANLWTFNVPVASSDPHNSEFDFTVGGSGYYALLASTVRNQGPSSIQSAGVIYQDLAVGTEPAASSVKVWGAASSHISQSSWVAFSGTLTSSGYTSGTPPAKFTTATNLTPAGYADFVALWAGGSCTGYLKNDGTCSTSSASESLDQVTALAASATNAFGAGFAWQLHGNTTAAALAAPTGMTDALTTGGTLGTTATYKVSTTYVNDAGQTINSSDIAPDLTTAGTCPSSGNCTITVTGPASSGNATAWCAYISTAGGASTTETLQSGATGGTGSLAGCSTTFSGTLAVGSIVAGVAKVAASTAYSYGHSVTSLNSTNNNPNVALAVSCLGSSTGCVPLVVNQQSVKAGDLIDVEMGGVKQFWVSNAGFVNASTGFTTGSSFTGTNFYGSSTGLYGPTSTGTNLNANTMTFGNPQCSSTTAAQGGGQVLVSGGNASGATANAIVAGTLTDSGGNITVGTGTGAVAGNVITESGACASVASASACNGRNIQLQSYYSTGTATQYSLGCITADYTLATCASAATGTNAIGWIYSSTTNQAIVQFGVGQVITGLSLSASFTAGQWACADLVTTAGDMIPSAVKCGTGVPGGVVLHTATTTNPVFVVTYF